MVRAGFAKRTLCVASRSSFVHLPLCLLSMVLAALAGLTVFEVAASAAKEESIPLPPPEASGKTQLEEAEGATPGPGAPQEPSHGETKSGADRHETGLDDAASSSSAAAEHGQAEEESGTESLVHGTPPAESSSPMAGLIWFGAVFLVLVCVIYLFL